MGHGCRTERIGLTAEVSVLETTGLNRLLIIFTNPAIVWWRELVCGWSFMSKILYLVLLTLLIFKANAEEAVVRSQAVVLSAPKGGADKVGLLEAETRVETGVRRGLWVELIKPSQGWVKLRSLKIGSAGTGSTSSSLSGLKSGREGVGNAVSASGVRGLDSEMIKLSDPDFQALEEFKKSTVVSIDAILSQLIEDLVVEKSPI